MQEPDLRWRQRFDNVQRSLLVGGALDLGSVLCIAGKAKARNAEPLPSWHPGEGPRVPPRR
jgi:hypothetical protein